MMHLDDRGDGRVRSVAILSMHTSPLDQPGTGDSGGMNVYVHELATSLALAGIDVRVYVRRDDPTSPDQVLVEPGLRVFNVDADPIGVDGGAGAPGVTGAAKVAKEDLPALVGPFAEAVARLELADPAGPADVIHANYWLSVEAGRLLRDRTGSPLVATFHTLARVKGEHGDPESPLREHIESELMNVCDAICVSNPVEADQIAALYDVDRSRLQIIPPGVDHAFFSPGDRGGARTALGLGPEPMVLFVGRIQPLKGLDLAVEALGDLPSDVTMVVVGGPSGPSGRAEVDKITQMVRAADLSDRVTFVAPQPHHLLSTYYRAADVVVVPSRSESFGLVALEAAACGTPVVAAEVGGLRSLVVDSVTGFLVGSRDPIDYAKRLDQILRDPELAASMGTAAAERGRGYSWPAAASLLLDLYAGVRREVSAGMDRRCLVSCS